MNASSIPVINLVLCVALASCVPDAPVASQQGEAPAVTNRLDVPPEVVNNLGITFETATRGRLGVWRMVPGQLEVPENRRWMLRAPAKAVFDREFPRATPTGCNRTNAGDA